MTDEFPRDIAEAYGDAPEEAPETESEASPVEGQNDGGDEPEIIEKAPEPDDSELLAIERDKYLRLAAEFDNFRRRSRAERDALYGEVKSETIGKFLPVFDDLTRAANAECADENYAQGVKMTLTKLTGIISGMGAEAFGESGDEFDPNKHNAVSKIKSDEVSPGKVALVYEKGFALGDKIVRHAIVAVAEE